ncbi:lytic transglycosylase domain-containing protein [Robbsia sp. KACC 23696]|uniref:lytic transglycosylase domain-containing protein n=1 Tax=Robbsia sp. KACC 23696 TaxID=3149231 RepID=UPI00325AC10D
MSAALSVRIRSLISRGPRSHIVRRSRLMLGRLLRLIDRPRRRQTSRSNTGARTRRIAPTLTRLVTGIVIASAGLMASSYRPGMPDRPEQAAEASRENENKRAEEARAEGASMIAAADAAACLGESLMPTAARPYARCWTNAGKRFGIDPLLLVAIGTVETRLRSNTIHRNTDGSRDLGLMQINSVHLPRLEQKGVTAAMLLENPCVSIMTGAEILAQNVRRHGYNWDAVGAYNAGSRADRHALRMRYADKVEREYARLVLHDDLSGEALQHAFSAPRAEVPISLRADPMRLAIRRPAG